MSSLLYAPLAFAEPKIHEVQPYPIDAPEDLVIWGKGFGEDPMIYFGTYPDPLDTSVLQDACDDMEAAPAPPLDPTGFMCIVAALPDGVLDEPEFGGGEPEVPSGDYLLKMVAIGQEVCTRKPASILFLHVPGDCSATDNTQDGDYCSGEADAADFEFE
ncbi:collagen-like protein, partial [Candidatus Fermentibacteria bacterium]